MNSKLLSIIAVFIGICLPMKMQAQGVATDITAPEFTFEGDNLVMTCETQGANIYYVMSEFANEEEAYSLSEALDVSEANSMRTLYTQPFPVTSNVVIKAVAKMPQQQGESEVTTLIYSYTAWSGLLSAIEYGSKVQERAKDSPLVSDDLKEQLQWALEEGQMIYGYRGQMPDSHEAEHFAEEILLIAHEIEEILNQQPAIAEVMLTGKNANYWYDETGTDPNGDEAVVFTLPENPDGGNLWEINVLTAFIRNQLAFTTPEGEAVDNITGEFRFESEGNMVALNDGKMLMYESADEQGEIAMIEPSMGMMRIINNEITQRLLNEPNSQFMALPVNVMAYQDGKEVPVINGRFTVLVRLEKQQKEPEPYAVLSQNNTVLTFYYDTNKERMNGMSVGPFTISYDEERRRDVINSGWDEQRENITTVIFDNSFANCTSITSTAYWFFRFENMTSITDISNLKTDNVTDMEDMFGWCSSLKSLDVSNFKTDNVINMRYMFSICSSLTSLDISGFNTENVTDMYNMFYDCSSLTTLDVSGFKTENVIYMDFMFGGCSSLTTLDVSKFNTDNVVNMMYMFDGCSGLTTLDVSRFNTDNVADMGYMFQGCSGLTSLDLSGFKTEHVTRMTNMFSRCSQLTTIYAGEGWNTSNVREGENLFKDCISLVGGAGTRYDANHTDHTYAHIDGGAANPGYFTSKNAPAQAEPYAVLSRNNAELTFYYDTNKERMNGMSVGPFMGGSLDENDNYIHDTSWYEQRLNITTVVFDESFANYTDLTSTAYWFTGCENLTSIIGIQNLNTGNVTNMSDMFYECFSLSNLDVSGFNTSNVTRMHRMFDGCSSLTSLDLHNFNTEHVYNMYMMFQRCSALTSLDVSSFNTSNVTDMLGMFGNCSSLTSLDLSNFNTEHVTNMWGMFQNCSNLENLNLSNFNTSNVELMGYMFSDCTSLRSLDLSAFDASNTSIDHMFLGCTNLTYLNVRNFNQSQVSNYPMFEGCVSLAAIQAGNTNFTDYHFREIGNPNLLLYVNEPSQAPQGVQNVVVNGLAREIILMDATEGNNNWHCPEPFRAEKITYTRNFRQQTEVGISRGWESIALPFTVQTITHETQGQIIPFGAQGTGKYFWLRGYSPEGLHRATVLEANTPYVISMPNNPTVYPAQYNLNGRVTFSAENTTVPATPEFEEMLITRGNITMAPIFVAVPRDEAVYAINVSQPLDRYAEGSVFTRELREVRPFEAATTHEPVNGARPKYIRIAAQPDDDITGIRTIELDETEGSWYSLDGRQMQGQPQRKGVYLQKGKKIVVK